jgi:hypothetical protein
MPDARSPAPIAQSLGERHVDWAAAARVEAERERRVERERDIGRGILAAGLVIIVPGLVLVLTAAGIAEIAGIVVMAIGAVVAVQGNRRLLRLDRFRASGGDASSVGAAWVSGCDAGGGGGGCGPGNAGGFGGHC